VTTGGSRSTAGSPLVSCRAGGSRTAAGSRVDVVKWTFNGPLAEHPAEWIEP